MRKLHELAIFAALLWGCVGQHAFAELATFDVRTRPVSEAEIAGGAPVGTVFEFYTTTQNDILSLAFKELSSDFYQHDLGSDLTPTPLSEHFPAISADSWFSFPGNTLVLGDGFHMEELGTTEALWGDLDRIGAVTDFQFGSLTVPLGKAANFNGRMSVANAASDAWYKYPLNFSVGATGEFDFQVSEAVCGNCRPSRPTPPPVVVPVPTPPPIPFPSPNDPLGQSPLVEFQVESRQVSAEEIAAGAPAGTVYDLFTTTPSDILSVAFSQLSGDFYHSRLGNDIQHPHPRVVAADPAATADTFFTTPGDTLVVGNGFTLESGQETLWGDLTDDGPVSNFQFGRVTVPNDTAAQIDGSFSIRGENGPERYPFLFSVDSHGTLSWGMVAIEEASPVPDPLPELVPVPVVDETPGVVVIPPTEAEVEPIDTPTREEIVELINNEVTTPQESVSLQEPTEEIIIPPLTTLPMVEVVDSTDWVIDPIDYVYEPTIINLEDLIALARHFASELSLTLTSALVSRLSIWSRLGITASRRMIY